MIGGVVSWKREREGDGEGEGEEEGKGEEKSDLFESVTEKYRYGRRQFVLTRVIDGDTVAGDIHHFMGYTFVQKDVRLRLCGIDTPEIRGEERVKGLVSKAFVESALPVGELIDIHIVKADNFGRLVALVQDPTGESVWINQTLLDRGLAEPYGKK